MKNIKKPELVSPAGDLEKLEIAYIYGADAAYVGLKGFNLREHSSLTLSELKKAILLKNRFKKKLYIAINSYFDNAEITKINKHINQIMNLDIDGIIISDPGFLSLLPTKKIPIHLSTQSNTTNFQSAKFWQNQGIKRIVLARELNIKEIAEIKAKNKNIQIEIFCHGAMCMGISGRCHMSKYITGRDANKGDCAHPCRFSYMFKERDKEDVYEVEFGEKILHLFSSKDLCTVSMIPDFVNAGIDALKIEGRMKSIYYLAIVTSVYRDAIDTYSRNKNEFQKKLSGWQKRLEEVSHRNYCTGFYQSDDEEETQNVSTRSAIQKYLFLGKVIKSNNKSIVVEMRNRMKTGDIVEFVVSPQGEIMNMQIDHIVRLPKREMIDICHNQYTVELSTNKKIPVNSLLRKRVLVLSGVDV